MTDSINDGMVIFCNRGYVMFTDNGGVVTEQKKTRKHTKNRSIVHHVFEDMKEFNTSSYWNDILTKFSRNIFPRNFRYYNNTLFYKSRKKNSKKEFLIDLENPEQSFSDMKYFLEDKGILSTLEKKEKSILVYREEIKLEEWKDFGKNQSYLIQEFIEEVSKKYELKEKEKITLESTIMFGISCDIFNNSTIIIEHGKILSIRGLEWDEKNSKFFMDKKSCLPKFTSSSRKTYVKNSKYSSYAFSGDTFCIQNKENILKIGEKWRTFLEDYYK